MTNVTESLEQIRSLINEGQLESALSLLTTLKPNSQRESRIVGHYQGIILFHQSRYKEACELLEKTQSEFGENVNLLRDLIACQYHNANMISFRENLDRLEARLVKHEQSLSARSLMECELLLGKFMEEEARLAPAILYYERALSRAEDSKSRLRTLLQKARWQACYEPTNELSALYRELISYPLEAASADVRVELQHALMLIELRLVGAEHAWNRVARIKIGAYEFDRRLVVFDFIEGSLTQDLSLQKEAFEMAESFDRLSPYDAFLLKLVKDPSESTSRLDELVDLAPQLSWASYLRLLCLTANRENGPAAKVELHRKIQLLIRGLDPRSQQLWNLRLKQALQSPELRVEFSTQSRSLLIQGKSIDLSKKKIGLQLLEALQSRSPLSVDEAIHLLWQSSFSPEHYHRLRMGIHRLNTLVNEITGLGKIVEVDSQFVRLRPEVKLRKDDPSFEVELLQV